MGYRCRIPQDFLSLAQVIIASPVQCKRNPENMTCWWALRTGVGDPCSRTPDASESGHNLVYELKHIIGAETTRKGILRVIEMFQHTQLNRRLAYVFLEGFLETLFSQCKFHELFNKLHSRSERMRKYRQRPQSYHAPALQKR
ncbi:unnamed protein product [Ranitomeya imitator]|uniref:Uncharacterized protein n=1 Tax=Ranitomeya imitator TaxID=111125 RepID=A0ABN9MM96_9NEOB|nr:unnamed protein product [Ranitomeya imitator]